jgi:hypothetical protein
MLGKSGNIAGDTASPTKSHRITRFEGWRNSIDEAYTGKHAGHRAVRNRLKVDIAPVIIGTWKEIQ